jgi:hypothetical protein
MLKFTNIALTTGFLACGRLKVEFSDGVVVGPIVRLRGLKRELSTL